MPFPIDPRCDYAVNPLAIDNLKPGFSWRLDPDAKGRHQTAWQVLVASSANLLAANTGDLWDSGKVSSSRSSAIVYGGTALCSRQECFWKVRLWDEEDREGEFSEDSRFEMGLLHEEDWEAKWIGWPAGRPGFATYFRCEFSLDFTPSKARLYISGLGLYHSWVNGQPNGDLLQPAFSDGGKRIFYNVFDVTSSLKKGANVLAATAGSGWKGMPMLFAQIEMEGPNGQRVTVSTRRKHEEPLWMATRGPIRANSIFDGETYDARKEKPGWDLPGHDIDNVADRVEGWMQACLIPAPGGKLQAQAIEPIQVIRHLTATRISEPKKGAFVFDFGQNHAGWARIQVQGPRGTEISLRFAETLYDDGTVNQSNLRTAAAEDIYILKGEGLETWEPRFTYHGYRYVQVEGWPGTPTAESVVSCQLRSTLAVRGNFQCGNDLLNRIHALIFATEESNLHGVPTDCPQRDERMGWINDLAARTEELVYNFDTYRFLSKFVDDVADTQDKTGSIGDTAPLHWGFQPADPISIAFLLVPALLYQHYGDTRVLETTYDSQRRWVDYLTSRAPEGILADTHFGDWAPPASEAVEGSDGTGAISAGTPGALVSTAFYCHSLELFAKSSRVLGRTAEAASYQKLADKVRKAFHSEFWSEERATCGSGNQACLAIALYFNLVPKDIRARAVERLVEKVRASDHHLTTGNLATKYVLEVLSSEGHADDAFLIATQTTYPSWGFMISRGATTLWERWEELAGGGMNSHNHPMFGSVGAWFYRHVAGIQFEDPSESSLRVSIRIPHFQDLKSAKASVQTISGPLSVEWQRDDISLTVKVQIPPNCETRLHLPDRTQHLAEGNHHFTCRLTQPAMSL